MLEILEKPPHSLSTTFSEWGKLPSWIVPQKMDYRLNSVFRQSLIQNTPPLWLVVIFGPSSLLLTTKNFDFTSENLDDLWPEDAGFGSRRYKA